MVCVVALKNLKKMFNLLCHTFYPYMHAHNFLFLKNIYFACFRSVDSHRIEKEKINSPKYKFLFLS